MTAIIKYRFNNGGVAKPEWYVGELRIPVTYRWPDFPMLFARIAERHPTALAIELTAITKDEA